MARLLKRHVDLIDQASERFQEAQSSWSKNHDEAREDFRFEAGQQWDEEVIRDRIGRPCLVVNKLYGVVQQIVGDQRQNRPSIKVRPFDSESDPDIAEVQTGLIRSIQNNSDAEAAYDTAFSHAVKGGFGYWRVNTKYTDCDAFEQDIVIERIIDPFSVYVDPMAQRADKSDARYILVCDVMSKSEFKKKYPKHQPSSWDSDLRGSWYPSDSVVVAEYWYKVPATKKLWLLEDGQTVDADEIGEDAVFEQEGERFLVSEMGPIRIVKERLSNYDKVMWSKLCGHAVLDEREWPGKYIPIVGVYGEETIVDGDIVYRSAIRYSRDAQRTYNWMRSTAVETIAQAPRQPYMATQEQIDGYETQWNQLHSKPMPYLLYNETGSGPPQRMGGSIPDIGAMQEAQIAADDIKSTTGIYDASLGAKGNETSGRAIMARQREGDTATFSFVDNLTRSIRLTGKIIVDLIPHIYDTQRTVRVLGEDMTEEVAEVNRVVMDPSEPQGFRVLNDLTRGKYDVVVTAGPSYTTKRVESAEAMLQFIQAVPQAGQVMLDLVARNMDWPGADEIAERLKKVLPPGIAEDKEDLTPEEMAARQQQQQKQQMMEQLQMKDVMLTLAEKEMALKEKDAKIAEMMAKMQREGIKLQGDMTEQGVDVISERIKQRGYELENRQREVDIQQDLGYLPTRQN